MDRATVRTALSQLDKGLQSTWSLGRNVIVGWRYESNKVFICAAPTARVIAAYEAHPRVFRGRRLLGKGTFQAICAHLRTEPYTFFVPSLIANDTHSISPKTIDNLIRRYTISYTSHRGVMLFDIVKFSRYTPLQQLAQLNGLEQALNRATQTMEQAGIRLELTRSTTGDGFYVWNRSKGFAQDINTLVAFILTLTFNAKEAQRQGQGAGRATPTVPTLRAAFSIGSHFSYYQVEGLSPRGFEYIVGDVTISLARLLHPALPGQILLGGFQRPISEDSLQPIGAVEFLGAAQGTLEKFRNLQIDTYTFDAIKTSFTGQRRPDGGTSVRRFEIIDKHGIAHPVFNMQLDLTCPYAPPIRLGTRSAQVDEFLAALKANSAEKNDAEP